MRTHAKPRTFGLNLSPWFIVGAALILGVVVVVMATINVRRERETISRILFEKGAGLINAFEAGTRTGMMGLLGRGATIQDLIVETAQTPGIDFIAITDRQGRLIAHDDSRAYPGMSWIEPADLAGLEPDQTLKARFVSNPDGERSFVVYKEFLPQAFSRPPTPFGPMRGGSWRGGPGAMGPAGPSGPGGPADLHGNPPPAPPDGALRWPGPHSSQSQHDGNAAEREMHDGRDWRQWRDWRDWRESRGMGMGMGMGRQNPQFSQDQPQPEAQPQGDATGQGGIGQGDTTAGEAQTQQAQQAQDPRQNPFLCTEGCEVLPERPASGGSPLIIFVGMDTAPFSQAASTAVRNTVITAAVLLLLGLGGVVSLYWAHNARLMRRLLSDTQAFAGEVVASLPLGLLTTDRDGRITYANEGAEMLTGRPRDKLLGAEPASVLPPELAGLLATPETRDPAQDPPVVEREVECQACTRTAPSSGDGPAKPRPLSVSASSIRTEDGGFVGRLLIVRDLSEVKRLQAEIRRREKLAAVGDLAAGVAHEIRNPLSSIKGYATYLGQKFPAGTDEAKAAQIMVGEVDRLNRVITELIEFARPSDLHLAELDVAPLVEHTLRLISRDAALAGVHIESEVREAQASVDPDRLSQALLNLYLNAIQAMPEGGTLRVGAGVDTDGTLHLQVADDGPGIPAEALSRIFDPYFTTKSTGTGLGLTIVHKIVEAHGGEVLVSSQTDPEAGPTGTKVELVFPTHPLTDDAAPTPTADRQEHTPHA